jgi:DNA polymerase-3 subunit delta'
MLLVSHAPGRLPATIRSRCRRLVLERLPENTVSELLTRHDADLPRDEAVQLARLSEGSVGRAIGLAEADGLALYRGMLALMQTLPGTDVVALHSFADGLAGRDAESAYRTATELLTWWIARMVGAGARGGVLSGGEVVPGEQGCAERLLGLAGVDQWVEVWEKIARLFAQADGINLDRKQVVLGAFHAMERAARA